MRKLSGFNLLELMIVLVIIGILSSVSLPIYSGHVIRARRLEAEMNLIRLSNALEKYFLLNNTYQNASLQNLNISEKISDNQYQLHIASATETDYLIEAIPLKNQEKSDTFCGILILDSEGSKKITGTGTTRECW